MSRRDCSSYVILFLSAVLPLTAGAQSNVNLEQGLKPYASFQSGEIDSVNLANGGVVLHAPLVSYPQRGEKLKLSFTIRYLSKNWRVIRAGTGTTTWLQWSYSGSGGVEVVRDQTISYSRLVFRGASASGGNAFVYKANTVDGSSHYIGSYETIDGTGIQQTFAGTNTGLVDRAGIRYTVPGYDWSMVSSEDPNGNQITATSSGWVDTLGRLIPATLSPGGIPLTIGVPTSDLSGCPAGTTSASIWNLPGPNGGISPVKLCYTNMTFQSSFGISTIRETTYGPLAVLTSILLPNQTIWLFSYNNFGDLVSVVLPTGGTLSYGWTTISSTCYDGLTPASRVVTSRTLDPNDGTGPKAWTYNWGIGVSVVVTDPAGNDTVHVVDSCSGYETRTQYFQGSYATGASLKTVNTEYMFLPNPFTAYTQDRSRAGVPTKVTTIWPNGKASQAQKIYDSGFTFFDANNLGRGSFQSTYGNVIEIDEFDYAQNTPGVVDPAQVSAGPLMRKTLTSYRGLDDPNYKNLNLLDLVSSTEIQDGTGARVARTNYDYDQTTLNSSGVTTQHNQNPVTGSLRGNRTSATAWLNTTNTFWPPSIATYFDTGMVYQATDPGGHTTTLTYSPAFAGSYVTQTQFPDTNSPDLAHHIISGNYDFNTGLITSVTDQNNQTATSLMTTCDALPQQTSQMVA